jgi:hypothetical protein
MTFPVATLRAGEKRAKAFVCVGTQVAVADARRAVDESDEANNSRTAGCPSPREPTDRGR